ncbi:MAG: TetR/AcrR family transcriptional regulator [Halioglobus sp.]|nr:TetR/AcrR family transcriptional regulator [Halioglobus sp.]
MEVQIIKRRISPQQKERRQHIIACARQLILEQGATMSMEAVAAMAGTSRSTLYRSFTSREHLIADVTLDAGYRLIEFLEQHPPQGRTVGGKISSLCAQVSTLAAGSSTLLAVCVNNIASEDPAVIDAQHEIERLISGIFGSVLGEVPVANRGKVESTIFRYLLGSFILATTGKLTFDEISTDLADLCRNLLSAVWDRDCTAQGQTS